MVENAPVNMMYADLDLKIRYINPHARRTLQSMEALPADEGRSR